MISFEGYKKDKENKTPPPETKVPEGLSHFAKNKKEERDDPTSRLKRKRDALRNELREIKDHLNTLPGYKEYEDLAWRREEGISKEELSAEFTALNVRFPGMREEVKRAAEQAHVRQDELARIEGKLSGDSGLKKAA
ncbi:MAG: hypothetical protein A3D67_00055 [Candidatus Lloydbacteria bacterium RIFCSPHIGHO2_02_FULL_51_22]|uniref:Uncharacterized protein n=2 Tax=Candidatus Lloydiibacteriota TaxID=1817910 RepID=A0A1G2DFF3_9BACT|nr:MAG: hypothetical protein A3D67_00055 [Candidatus Lloydbacteria bacterium RIFCSPHIGHO2_02_FULL_51_22]OGZ14815.1 MAG: hypothetical protein A3J08_00555 [Candidatus Lloydbacteria bacterium RIFCSPLOWO2_02_FULL_51_11]